MFAAEWQVAGFRTHLQRPGDMITYDAAGWSVLVAVDDVQWLDSASAAALAYALRRIDQVSYVALLARRPQQAEADGLANLLDDLDVVGDARPGVEVELDHC